MTRSRTLEVAGALAALCGVVLTVHIVLNWLLDLFFEGHASTLVSRRSLKSARVPRIRINSSRCVVDVGQASFQLLWANQGRPDEHRWVSSSLHLAKCHLPISHFGRGTRLDKS